MGEVYEAAHVSLQRRVAIKVLHPDWCKNPDLVKRFFNEALATNLIRHPAMVEIHDHRKFPDGMPFLIMEFLEGQSLRRYRGTLQPLQVVRLAWQVTSGLRAAHAKKIVHRDLKPDNVMVIRDDTVPGGQRVKILDFGLAKLLSGMLLLAPPDLSALRGGDLKGWAPLALRLKRLGDADMMELMRVLPMAVRDYLDEWFESDVLKGALGGSAVVGATLGPRGAGTNLGFFYQNLGAPMPPATGRTCNSPPRFW